MTCTRKVTLFQICYDDQSFCNLETGFTPLDNRDGPPEFREIVPIFSYLKENDLEEDEWLGFFSPKFSEKTGLGANDVLDEVRTYGGDHDVILFTSGWTQIAFYQNVWEHGEFCHPGLLGISEELAREAGYALDFDNLISVLDNSVFSHFLVAKKAFWMEWFRIVEVYFHMLIAKDELFLLRTKHGQDEIEMHPFIIERVPSLILAANKFMAKSCDKITKANTSTHADLMFNPAYDFGSNMIKQMPSLLEKANFQKGMYLRTGDKKFLDEYWQFRFWAPQLYGYANLTTFALNYIQENITGAHLNGVWYK